MGYRHGGIILGGRSLPGIKSGTGFEAAIPIAIIAVGVSGAAKRKNALGENVIIQSIGACSGVIVAGAIFTLPALYILQDKYPEMTVNFFQMFVSSLLGGIWGSCSSSPSVNISSATNMANIPSPKPLPVRKCLFPARKAEARQSHCFCRTNRRSVRFHCSYIRLVE